MKWSLIGNLKGAQGEPGIPGKSAYVIAKEYGFSGTEMEWLESLRGKHGPPGESIVGPRGESIVGEKGDPGRDGRDGKDARDPVDGIDGEPGRDALQIEPLDLIEESKSYGRGTYACHDGGLLRAVRKTDPVKDGDIVRAGWQVVVAGIKDVEVQTLNERAFSIVAKLTGGQEIAKTIAIPTLIYKGVWTEQQYERGDTVTWDGSMWHCQNATSDRPGTSQAWKLAAKRGRDGKDGKPGDKGDRGEVGRAGKDLTHMDFNGTKY